MSQRPTDRRRVGGDVFLASYPPGAPSELRIDIGFEVAGWKARSEGAFHRASFPGTAIQVEDRWYEIVDISSSIGAPRRIYYDLRPWDDSAVIRTTFELSADACQALTTRTREQERRRKQASALGLFPVVVGMLPAKDQKSIESAYGLSAVACTKISAIVLLPLSVAVMGTTIALILGTAFGELKDLVRTVAWFSPLAAYVFIESLARLYSVEPGGTLPVVLPIYIYRGLREAATSGGRPSQPVADVRGILGARDHVRPIEGREDQLEVVSRLAKDHWTANVTGIEYQGVAYVLVARGVIETDAGPRHRFVLQKPEQEVLFKSYVRYQPEEVRDIYRQQRRIKTAMWVETFAFLWGLLDQPTQERLAKLYNYDAEKWTRHTILAAVLLGAFLAGRSLWLAPSGLARLSDGVAFFIGMFLCWEGALRWSKYTEGQLRRSLLGLPLRPLAVWLLRWE